MTEDEMNEIALDKARDFKDGNPAPFLAQMKWEQHLMREQHKLNKRVVIIATIITALSGVAGGLIQRYGLDFLLPSKSQIQQQMKPEQAAHTEIHSPKSGDGQTNAR